MKSTQTLLICFSVVLLSFCKKNETSPSAVLPLETESEQPEAKFTASKYFAKLNDTVKFTNQSQNAETYEWDFGDGEKSKEASPKHVYKTKGIYRVTLVCGNGAFTSRHDTTIRYGLKAFVHFKFYVSKWKHSGSSEASLFRFGVSFFKNTQSGAIKTMDLSSGIIQVAGANGLISAEIPLDDEFATYYAKLSITNSSMCGNGFPAQSIEVFEPFDLPTFKFRNEMVINNSKTYRRFDINYEISETVIQN